MKRASLILAGIFLLLVVGVAIVLLIYFQINKDIDSNNNYEDSVMEFPALTLCRQTGGNWNAVNASEFPLSEEEGVYNPTTNFEINHKCFCPAGQKWSEEKGCSK